MRRTKIVCTIGPASAAPEQLWQLAQTGMDVARLNFAHGSHECTASASELIRGLEGVEAEQQ